MYMYQTDFAAVQTDLLTLTLCYWSYPDWSGLFLADPWCRTLPEKKSCIQSRKDQVCIICKSVFNLQAPISHSIYRAAHNYLAKSSVFGYRFCEWLLAVADAASINSNVNVKTFKAAAVLVNTRSYLPLLSELMMVKLFQQYRSLIHFTSSPAVNRCINEEKRLRAR